MHIVASLSLHFNFIGQGFRRLVTTSGSVTRAGNRAAPVSAMRYQRHDGFTDNGSIKSQVFRPPGGGSFYTRTTRFLGISFRRSASEIPSHHLEGVVGLSFQSLQKTIPIMTKTKPQLGNGTGIVKEAAEDNSGGDIAVAELAAAAPRPCGDEDALENKEEDDSEFFTSAMKLLDEVLKNFDAKYPK